MLSRIQFQRLDWLLAVSALLLGTLGLIILYSLEVNSGQSLTLFYKQLIFFFVGIGLFIAVISFNYIHLTSYAWWLYIAGLVLLVGVLLFGQEIRGLRGWFVIGPVSIQPVEFIKIIVVLFFARFFSVYGNSMQQVKYIVLSIALMVPYLGLIALQPDMGSAFIIVMTWVVMFLFTRVQSKQLIFLTVLAALLALFSWQFLADYQQNRLITFLNPEADPLGQGYNVRQAVMAVGSGQLLGRGLGLGPQSQLHFLPENKTDFIFSVIAEELGFVGAGAVIIVFGFIFYRMIRIARNTEQVFGFYIVVGVMSFIAVQTFMNIAMNMSLFPVTGIPLPLISQGGSSLWAVLIALALAENVKIFDRAQS